MGRRYCRVHRRLQTADANRALIHPGPCRVHAIHIGNTTSTAYKQYLKLFDVARLPNLGSDNPIWAQISQASTTTRNNFVRFSGGIDLVNGLAMAVVTDFAGGITGLIDQGTTPLAYDNHAVYHIFYEVL